MNDPINNRVFELIDKGVRIPNPYSVTIGSEVDLQRISGDGVVIHSGSKIFGNSTYIGPGAQLGYEGPVTVEDCQIGPNVKLKGGYLKKSVFLEKSSIGLGGHIREGTILEEQASGAHTVGLKQTILFPFVTLGSLINFCDCLMAGGTSRKDHSEVGSSYIHFNYTPNQDKATPSLIGDVPRGVMLNQKPVFLGGQGGLVGPRRLAFGTVIAAGTIYRKDELREGRLLFDGIPKAGSIPFKSGIYDTIKSLVKINLNYIGNLHALKQWYRFVRAQFVSAQFPVALLEGLLTNIDLAIGERLYRLKLLAHKMPTAINTYQQLLGSKASSKLITQKKDFHANFPQLEEACSALDDYGGTEALRDPFLEKIQTQIDKYGLDYLVVIKNLNQQQSTAGILWLQNIVDTFNRQYLKIFSSFN